MALDQILERTKPYADWGLSPRRSSVSMLANHHYQHSGGRYSQSGCVYGHLSTAARRMATSSSTDLATFKGYDNRAKRDELVAAIIADI